ncbi:MAG: integrase arm-type DNA-binding domain-containing protein [Pseudomonadota bacterium]|nr:integrase arm-type DNA-binding domain-containing protein [Pseudomonadota bacterium]
MPKLATPLTDIQVRNAKPKSKAYTLADGGGMYLEVAPTGSKIWRMSYRQPNGKNTRLTFGAYPEVSLLAARQKRAEARTLRAAGTDPAQAKRIAKTNKDAANANTFEAVAREWHANKLDTWQERTATNIMHRLRSIGAMAKSGVAGLLDALRELRLVDME